MPLYKKVKGPHNNVRYSKNGIFISKDKIPISVLEELTRTNVVDVPIKECVFCGVGCKFTRLVNLQTVYLCDEHYYSKTIGQIAQQIRENSDAKSRKEEVPIHA